MQTSSSSRIVASGVLAAALALPAAWAVAEPAGSVTLRDAQALERSYGRAAPDAYWVQRPVSDVPAPVVRAYDQTVALLTQPAPERGPERFGRAGGFVGLDKFEMRNWDSASSPAMSESFDGDSYGRAGAMLDG